VHEGTITQLLELPEVPGHPVAACGDDRRLVFFRVDGDKMVADESLKRFPEKLERMCYDPAAQALRVACSGVDEYAWRYEADGKWRQFHEQQG
jgi:hypothetical protein